MLNMHKSYATVSANVFRAHRSICVKITVAEWDLSELFGSVESKLQYAAPAWSGFCTAGDWNRLNSFLRRCVKLGYRDKSAPSIEDILDDCDDQLFSRINTNSLHILLVSLFFPANHHITS